MFLAMMMMQFINTLILKVLRQDVTKTRNGTVNGTIHGMGKLHGKALFYRYKR